MKEHAPNGTSALATALRLFQNRKHLPPIERVDNAGPQRLSYAQELLWLFQQVHPESRTYNLVHAFRLIGALNVAALEQTLNEIVRRHAILRTTYQLDDEYPVQRVRAFEYRPFPITDLRAHTKSEQPIKVEAYVQAQQQQLFDLSQHPPFRFSLLQLQDDEFVLVFCLHHILYEVSSERVLFHELGILYKAFEAGEPSPLPNLPIQYTDYAAWQRQILTEETLAEKIDFHRQLLGDELPALNLPTDSPRSNERDFICNTLTVAMDPELHQMLRRFSQSTGASLFNILLTTLYMLLYRYTGQTKIVVGTPVNGRNHAHLNKLLGIFVNEVALPGDLSDNPTFEQLLARVQQTTGAAYQHPDLPFHKLFPHLSGGHGRTYFPVTFNMPAGRNEMQLHGLTVERLPLHRVHSQADLFFTVLPNHGELSLHVTYQADLFNEAQIARLADHYQTLLAAIVNPVVDAALPVSQLPMLTEAEYHQIVHQWNDTAVNFGEPQAIHTLFAAQAARTPDAVAVVFGDQQLTYAELNARANQLAHHLIELGVQANTLVAVAMEPALEMIVSLLAILKAGGAYVPIDPTYPSERIHYMLLDSATPILLTQSRLPNVQAMGAGNVQRIAVDTAWGQLANLPTHNPQPRASLDDLIYVIYTSGSTGRPKGAGVYHRGFGNLLNWFITAFQLDSRDSVLLISSPSFDLTQKNLFAPLLVGGQLHLINGYDPKGMVELIGRHHISWINCTPSAFYPLIEQADGASLQQLRSLRYVFLGGEPITFTRLQHWLNDENIHTQVVNTYGPTECTDICAAYTVPQGFTAGTIPIGRPIHNVQLYILDANRQPTPIKVAGELCIGGAGLGMGYLNRPELTAERFIEHPEFGRLYKTGDLCRWLPDGNIEYIGRTDFQVKIRGFRIELGEIERALLAQEGVQETAVIVREDQPDDQRLVAYLVGKAENDTLRHQLAQRLPAYMVPTAFVTLSALPLTPNGKLDRRALPAPNYETDQATFVAPRNAFERQLAALWCDVLNVKQVGINDNFFALGGHSLLAARMINVLQKQLGEIIHITAVFDAPTIAQLIDYLHRHYPQTVERLGESSQQTESEAKADEVAPAAIDEAALAKARAALSIFSSSTKPALSQSKNKPAAFVFSSMRTGSTLLRVILAGHPLLFAPPELGLLGFPTLAERRASKADASQSMLDGPVYALQEIANLDFAAARMLMQQFEERQLTIPQFYHELQTRLGERLLVDKTPTYTFNLATLRNAEQTFTYNRYIFLVRHPYGMIHSFEEARLDLAWPQEVRQQLNYTRRQLAELIWLLSYRNIQAFAAEIPTARQHWVRYEDLVTQPQATVEAICDFLQIDFRPKMLQPYADQKQRMTAGATESSRMLGDVKFHQHTTIDPAVADTWRQTYQTDFLSDLTWQLAKTFDYAPIQSEPTLQTIQRIRQVTPSPAQIDQLSDTQVADQLQALLAKRLAAKS